MRKIYAKQTCSFFLTCYNYSITDSKVNNANFYYQVIKNLLPAKILQQKNLLLTKELTAA